MALTAQEQKEMQALEMELSPKPKTSGGLSPEEAAEMASLEQEVGAQESPGLMSKAMSMGGKGLDYGIRALDLPGGAVRTGLANVAGLISGKGNIVTEKDLGNMAAGKAPTSAEYMERLGVPAGPSVSLPVFGDTSARDAAGLVGDIVTDPLTAISKSVKALRPASTAAESVGKAVYKSGLKKVDERLAEKGAGSIADVLLEEGKTGTTKKLAKDAKEISKNLGKERDALYQKATEKGVSIDMGFPLANAENELKKLASDPGLAPMAEKFGELLERYKKSGKVDIKTLSDWKTNLYNALPEAAYDQHGKLKGPAQKFQKALASDFKQAIVEAGNKAEKGLGDNIDKINEKWATVIGADKPMAMQVRRAGTPNLVTSVDAMIAGLGGAATGIGPTTGALALKKAADASKTTYVRTKAGKGLIDLGKTGLLDNAGRRGLINTRRGLMEED